jgi:hypothetical protein
LLPLEQDPLAGIRLPYDQRTGGTALNGKAPEHFVPEVIHIVATIRSCYPDRSICGTIGGCAHFSSSTVIARYCGGELRLPGRRQHWTTVLGVDDDVQERGRSRDRLKANGGRSSRASTTELERHPSPHLLEFVIRERKKTTYHTRGRLRSNDRR